MTSIHSSVYNVIIIIMHCYIFRAHEPSRTYTIHKSTSISQWFRSTIYQVNNFFALFKKKKLLHTYTLKTTDPFICLECFPNNHTASQDSFIKSYEAKEKKLSKRESTQKSSSTSFVIDDEESNHVNLTFCCTLSLFYYLISIFLA